MPSPDVSVTERRTTATVMVIQCRISCIMIKIRKTVFKYEIQVNPEAADYPGKWHE